MKTVKKFLLRNWFWLSLGLVLTRKAVECAYYERGYVAVGGEWMILPVLMITVHFVRDNIRRRKI